MTRVVAYSGIENTGKSSEIEMLTHELSWRIIYPEIARKLFDLLPSPNNGIEDLTLFQEAIRAMEHERLHKIKEKTQQALAIRAIVDRTFYDSVLYNNYNVATGKSKLTDPVNVDDNIYDDIVLFTIPFKDNNRFAHYNSNEFREMFIAGMQQRYWDKVKLFDNAADSNYKERRKDTFNL